MVTLNSSEYRVLQAISRNVPAPLDAACTAALIELRRTKLVLLQRDEEGRPLRDVPTLAGLTALRCAT